MPELPPLKTTITLRKIEKNLSRFVLLNDILTFHRCNMPISGAAQKSTVMSTQTLDWVELVAPTTRLLPSRGSV